MIKYSTKQEEGRSVIFLFFYRWPNLSRIKQETIKTQIEGYNL